MVKAGYQKGRGEGRSEDYPQYCNITNKLKNPSFMISMELFTVQSRQSIKFPPFLGSRELHRIHLRNNKEGVCDGV